MGYLTKNDCLPGLALDNDDDEVSEIGKGDFHFGTKHKPFGDICSLYVLKSKW